MTGLTAGQAAKTAADGPWPPVSVVLVTRGRPQQVREAVGSVIAQDYPGAIECIVVHDREPADPDLAALAAPGRTVTAIVNTRSPGLAGARNTGVGLASADLIASCDDDDTWHPGKLRAQVARLMAEPQLLAVGSGMRLMLAGGKIHNWPARAEVISYQLLLRNRVKELHSSTLLMRREAFSRAGGYDEMLPGGYAEDYDWVLRMARIGPLGLVIEPLADIRKDASSWYAGRAAGTVAGLRYLLAKHPDIARSARGHARILGQLALASGELGERHQGLRYAARALCRWPLSPHPWFALVQLSTGISPRHLRRAARLLGRGTA